MPLVIAIILAAAALIGWRALQPVCPGGAVVADAAQCTAQFDGLFCLDALPQMQHAATTSGESFPSQAACLDQWPVCIARSDVSAWSPRPASWCVVRAADGGVARLAPIYARR